MKDWNIHIKCLTKLLLPFIDKKVYELYSAFIRCIMRVIHRYGETEDEPSMSKTKGNQHPLTMGLFVIYLLALIWIILFKMSLSLQQLPEFRGMNFIPFGGSVMTNDRLDLSEIINNIVIFVPFGLYLCMVKPEWRLIKNIILIAAVSFSFEIIQFIFAIGGTDITDLLGNTLGGVIGIGIYSLLYKWITKRNTNKILTILALIGTICFIALFGLLFVANH